MEYELLAGLGEEERRAALAVAIRRKFAKREVVWHEGDLGDTFHLLAKGRVAVRVTTPAGEVATLNILGPGAGFGEQALLDPESRRSSPSAAAASRSSTAPPSPIGPGSSGAEPAVVDQAGNTERNSEARSTPMT